MLIGPTLAVGGIVRGVNNSTVNNRIELRQTTMPLEKPVSEERDLNIPLLSRSFKKMGQTVTGLATFVLSFA